MTMIDPGSSVVAARRALARMFAAAGLETPELDARVLVGHALGLDHAALAGAADRPLDNEARRGIGGLASRRLAREPVARIVGCKEFWGLPIRVTPDVLVPRPETETLVETALAALSAQGPRAHPWRVADLGTGSGALLAALLHELSGAVAIGTDRSAAALAVARDNLARLGFAGRAALAVCDFGAALAGGFDLVVANPPYVAHQEIAQLAPEIREHDPHIALDGGPDGLACYRAVAIDAGRLLRPDGHLVLELGAGQAAPVGAMFARSGLVVVAANRDLAGIPRALHVRR